MPFLLPVAALAVAQLFDYVSFLAMVSRHGLAAEANPIVIGLAEGAGLPGLTLAKLAAVLLAALAFALLARRRRAMAATIVTFGIVAGVVGGVSNVLTL